MLTATRRNQRALSGVVALILLAFAASVTAQSYDLTRLYPDNKAMEQAKKQVRDSKLSDAHKSYLTAAKYGNKEAQKLIGLQYLDGQGVEQDLARAHAWLQLASSFGDKRIVLAYKDLDLTINDELRADAAKYHKKLQKEYGDPTALKKRKKWVRKEIRDMSGSGAKRPSPSTRVAVSLTPGRQTTITMRELNETLDGYVDDFKEKVDGKS